MSAALTEGMEPVAWMSADKYWMWSNKGSIPINWQGNLIELYTADQLAAAGLAERERCAKICENFAITDLGKAYGGQYASAIRGQKS